MLEKLTLKNFQKHKLRTIELSPTLTVLVGDSRRGKSAILRALYWMCTGGTATDYLRWNEESLKVILAVDQHKITRIKSKSQNSYQLGSNEPYRAVKTSVPETIAALLNVTDINFQQQADPAFWLSLSAPDAAKQLNKVFSLDLIDQSLRNVANKVRKAVVQEEYLSQKLEQQQAMVDNLSWVEEADRQLVTIENTERERDEAQNNYSTLQSTVGAIAQLTAKIENVMRFVTAIEASKATAEKLRITNARYIALGALLETIETLSDKLSKTSCRLESVEEELGRLQEKCPLCGNRNE